MKDKLYKETGIHGCRLRSGALCSIWIASRVIPWRSDGIKYSEHTVWHTFRSRFTSQDDRSNFDGAWSYGFRDDVHYGLYDWGLAWHSDGHYSNREKRNGNNRT